LGLPTTSGIGGPGSRSLGAGMMQQLFIHCGGGTSIDPTSSFTQAASASADGLCIGSQGVLKAATLRGSCVSQAMVRLPPDFVSLPVRFPMAGEAVTSENLVISKTSIILRMESCIDQRLNLFRGRLFTPDRVLLQLSAESPLVFVDGKTTKRIWSEHVARLTKRRVASQEHSCVLQQEIVMSDLSAKSSASVELIPKLR